MLLTAQPGKIRADMPTDSLENLMQNYDYKKAQGISTSSGHEFFGGKSYISTCYM